MQKMSMLNYENQFIQIEIKYELSIMGILASQGTISGAIQEINFSRTKVQLYRQQRIHAVPLRADDYIHSELSIYPLEIDFS